MKTKRNIVKEIFKGLKDDYKNASRKSLILMITGVFLIIVIIALTTTMINNKNEYLAHQTYVEIYVPDNYSCLLTKEENIPLSDDINWQEETNNKCLVEFNDLEISKIYLKDENDNIIAFNDTTTLSLLGLNDKELIYMVKGDTYQLHSIFNKYGEDSPSLIYISSNTDVATVDDNGLITSVGDGESIISAINGGNEYNIKVICTTLLVQRPKEYDFDKEYVECEQYTKQQNEVIDTYLEEKVKEAGYHSRAGALEAMRFLTLDFPYKITYMFENGRLAYGVDGEGRYYHKGLYLSSSKYEDIKNPAYGPGTWGCPIYQFEFEYEKDNGLDCSGLVSWALLNGGYDVGDIGAGGDGNGAFALWDLGEPTKTTTDMLNKIKAGDLVHSDENGGHIGMIVGIDDEHFYVAQAYWHNTVGCVITTFSKQEFVDYWDLTMLMDSYYEKDGNYTAMWY